MEPGLILMGGTVLTLDPDRREGEAVAIGGGRILAVGDAEDVVGLAGKGCRVVDLAGKTVVPGFADAHAHLLREGGRRSWLDLSGTRSLGDLQERLAAATKGRGPGEWVLGGGWDESPWPLRRFPTMANLDRACPRNPVLIVRVDGHAGVVNSAGLSALKLPPSVRGVETEGGQATGRLTEDALRHARRLVRKGRDFLLRELPRMTRMALSRGVTCIHDVVSVEDVDVYLQARKAGLLNLRAVLMPIAREPIAVPRIGGNDLLRIGPWKVFADGSFGARTAALCEGYADRPGARGMLVHSREDLTRLIAAAHSKGSPTAIHAIGDRGISEVLDAYEEAGTLPGDRVEHFELPRGEGISRARRMGVTASMQPNFVGRWGLPGGTYEERLGEDRARETNPFRRILDAGVPLIFGSDGMPMSPLYGVHWAVNAPHDGQRIPVEQALEAYALTPAEAAGEGGFRGSIAAGKAADLVVLSGDPRDSPEAIADLRVEMTVLAGDIAYERPSS